MTIKNLNIGPYTKRFNPKPDNKKFILHHDRYNLFDAFDSVHPLAGKTILDFGGSFGNLIETSSEKINPMHYTCIDVDQSSLKLGRDRFPLAKWQYKDLYNPMYNPEGSEEMALEGLYDVIIAYSVFTHDSFNSLVNYVRCFKNHLSHDGKIFITILTNDSNNVDHIINKRIELYGDCDGIDTTCEINYLVNNKIRRHIPQKFSCDFLYTFYKSDFIAKYGTLHEGQLPQIILEVDKDAF